VPPGSREPEALTLPEEGNQHELEKRVAELAGILETVAANQGQLAGGLREFHEVTQRIVDEVEQLRTLVPTGGRQGPLDVEPPVPVEAGDNSTRLRATQAVTHGEQIRYEAGPDRDNLGFWTNANDWAEWEVDIARPGCFKVTAEIAALAGSRFQVVLADQTLEGSAPNTGDYGRFQQVEVGAVELTSAGKTRVAVRPIPEGWQPMNLRSLDLALFPA
jgi:hypothetical protein